MKRWGMILLAAALCAMLFGAEAQASPAEAAGRNGVYIGQGDRLWQSGTQQSLTREAVSAIYAQGPSWVIYAVGSQAGRTQTLYAMDLAGARPQARQIAREVTAVAWSREEGVVYYVSGQAPKALYGYDLAEQSSQLLTQAQQPIAGLRLSADGLLAQVEGRELLYIPVVRLLAAPLFSRQGYVLEAGHGFETLLDRDGGLSLRRAGQTDSTALDSGVVASRIAGRHVYYLARKGTGSALMVYRVAAGEKRQLCLLDRDMLPQLVVDAAAVYLMDQAGNVYAYDLAAGRLDRLGAVGAQQPVLEAAGEMVLIYDQQGAPGRRFVAAMALRGVEEPEDRPLERHAHLHEGEEEPETRPGTRKKEGRDLLTGRKKAPAVSEGDRAENSAAPGREEGAAPAKGEKEQEERLGHRGEERRDRLIGQKGEKAPAVSEKGRIEKEPAAPGREAEPAAPEKGGVEEEPAVPEKGGVEEEPAAPESTPAERKNEKETGALSLAAWEDGVERLQAALDDLLSRAKGIFDGVFQP